jgi:outer membrane protein TolC
MMISKRCWIIAATGASLLGGCSLAPVYHVPTISVKADAWNDNPWQVAKPADDMPHGDWWKLYGDPVLDGLESQIEQANPNLAAALARYDQATAYTECRAFPHGGCGSRIHS